MCWCCLRAPDTSASRPSRDLLVVGAYPPGQENYDLIREEPEKLAAAVKRIAKVALPVSDPIHGRNGPLNRLWTSQDAR